MVGVTHLALMLSGLAVLVFYMYLAVRPQHVRNHWLHRAGLVGFAIGVVGVLFAAAGNIDGGICFIAVGQFVVLAASVGSCAHPHQRREWEE
jgi:hypothetical protein